MQVEKKIATVAEEYYDSDKGFKFYSVVNSTDYSGIGLYPEEHTEIDHLGVNYPRGDCLGIRDATIARNVKLLEKIKKYAPQRKLKLIEFGSGRGGFAIQIAQELDKADMLEKFTATNISTRENDYNQKTAREQGLTEDKYEVKYMSFDELDHLQDGAFDVICSNEAILYS